VLKQGRGSFKHHFSVRLCCADSNGMRSSEQEPLERLSSLQHSVDVAPGMPLSDGMKLLRCSVYGSSVQGVSHTGGLHGGSPHATTVPIPQHYASNTHCMHINCTKLAVFRMVIGKPADA
jgi:hypothetical protein